MFIPIVPSVQRVKVINKIVVCSDTVIKLDSLGKDIKVTSLDSIKESELEKCIKYIFESNEDVLYQTFKFEDFLFLIIYLLFVMIVMLMKNCMF